MPNANIDENENINDIIPAAMAAKLEEFKRKYNCDIDVMLGDEKTLRFVGKDYRVYLDRVGGYWAGSGVNDEEFEVGEAERGVIVHDIKLKAISREDDTHFVPVEAQVTIEFTNGTDIDTVVDSKELIEYIDDETSEDLYDAVEQLLDEGESYSSVTLDEIDLLECDRYDSFLAERYVMSRLDDVLAELAKHFQ